MLPLLDPDPPAIFQPQRFIGMDIDKRTVVVIGLDPKQKTVIGPVRISLDRFEGWCLANLKSDDAVVMEASVNTWHLYDLILPLVGSVTVAHPLMVRLITAARVKTDKEDAYKLARLLQAEMVPEVWVPPHHVRELRALVAHRKRLISQRTQARNRLHAVLHRHNLVPPKATPFAACYREWWLELKLDPCEKLRVRQDLTLLDTLGPLITEVETELIQLSQATEWAEAATYLVQLPGLGIVSAMIILSAIGDITRFAAAEKLVGYAGLGASVHSSGQTHQTGGITKEGRRELRTALVESAWSAVEHHPHWKARFDKLAGRMGKKKAIVAIARKLLVTVWHVLFKREVDRQAVPEKVALKLIIWSRKLKPEGRHGQSTAEFVRSRLDRLGLGAELEEVGWPSTPKLHLPPSSLRYDGSLTTVPTQMVASS
ncbi:MAG: hypothetical protein BGO39_08390 [Chloroflexi bacterium 54-19]|nr:MAG: hypothetical protein BGO39_08390 [Chloroflexi bacterium 54-19]